MTLRSGSRTKIPCAFGPNRSRRIAEFSDGTGQTLMATDVKALQPLRRCSTQLAKINNPGVVPPADSDPYTVAPEYGSAACSPGPGCGPTSPPSWSGW